MSHGLHLPEMQEVMMHMLDCLCAAIAKIEAEGGPAVCMCTILPGEAVPMDYCGNGDCGGMAWVRLQSLTQDESASFTPASCFLPLVATIEVGVLRSVEFDGQTLPSGEDQLRMALRQLDDMEAVQKALECCTADHKFRVGAYNPVGPQGGCFGGTWTVSMDV